ncbi:mitochondrial 54S ribosomal protein YmL10/YmL18 [Saccharomycopsis crataegensis]|uniref:Mitochondrial 54S ribosomal protein YmL10/YmL18 n=1 Tax=Saccharomycopsis crataegensis TaxID=43959 RepID=A0AAV5QNV2_9ASCO|nr:mitochondrial 54S ribosomal protein YmL10/YmL18 [Saccharomycopsis crataegensis]
MLSSLKTSLFTQYAGCVSILQSTRSLSLMGNLKPSYKSTKIFKRLGRGPSSGHGKTSGRGQKGQKARSSVKSWFEGGQTPIYKLFPKIGFKPFTSLELTELNLKRIQKFYSEGKLQLEEGEVLTMKKMKEVGLISGNIHDGVKILGDGKDFFKVPNLKVEATRASADVIEAIESNGGEFTAKYYNKLALKAHLAPNWFLKKYGRLPLEARPTRRKDIEYYSREHGYLTKQNHELLKLKEQYQSDFSKSFKKRVNKLEEQLQLASSENNNTMNTSHLNKSGIISINDL